MKERGNKAVIYIIVTKKRPEDKTYRSFFESVLNKTRPGLLLYRLRNGCYSIRNRQ